MNPPTFASEGKEIVRVTSGASVSLKSSFFIWMSEMKSNSCRLLSRYQSKDFFTVLIVDRLGLDPFVVCEV